MFLCQHHLYSNTVNSIIAVTVRVPHGITRLDIPYTISGLRS